MGRDKVENEELIKYGWPEDIWFHVDKHSSAHVYLRLREGETIDSISQNVLEDCAQLVKGNSIEGNKINNVSVVYTPWTNLKKTNAMEVGQVGFHQAQLVRKIQVEKRKNEIMNRLNKTKKEDFPDLAAMREKRDKTERDKKKTLINEQKRIEKMEIEQKKIEDDLKSYTSLMMGAEMKSNRDAKKSMEDDFM